MRTWLIGLVNATPTPPADLRLRQKHDTPGIRGLDQYVLAPLGEISDPWRRASALLAFVESFHVNGPITPSVRRQGRES
jgi:hypothetical protein